LRTDIISGELDIVSANLIDTKPPAIQLSLLEHP
jgi:hypothetical protein